MQPDITPYFPIVQKSMLFSGVQADEVAAMLGCLGARAAAFAKGDFILRPGERATALGLLLGGTAHIAQEDFWGNRNILSRVQPGQLFAESFACTPGAVLDIGVVADSPATVLFLEVGRVLTTCSAACGFHSRVVRNLLADMAGKNLRFHEKLTHMAQRTTRQKLLSYLSAESGRQGSAQFDIPFDRQQLADYLSVDRSAMSAELSRLRREGVLDYCRNHFTLLQPSPA